MPLGGLKKLLIRIGADTTELDKKVTESSRRIEKVGQRLDRLGRSLSLNVTAPILAFGGASVASSIRFEDAMAGVAKTVDASAETITALGDEFKALSEQIPVAATELANIGEAAGQLGIETSNILGFTRVIADLGVATNLTSEEAATDLARLANITGMPQDAFDRLGSTVVALGNNLATTEREIVAMGLRLAGAGTQVGLTEDQILALAASLSSVGIEAESGGTALSKVMAEMAIAVGDGGDKLEQFARIAGMSGAEFAESFETDAADALVTFVEGLGRLSDEGVNVFQVLESVEFGNDRVRRALLSAAGAGDLMRKSLDLGSTAWQENTALTIEAEKAYATTGNQLKIAWNQVRNMAAELGDNLTPALLAMVDAAKPVLGFLRDMIKGFGELPKGVQATAFAFVALTAALGPALVAIGRITIAIGVLTGAAALGGLSSMLAAGAPIMVGLAAVAAMFLVLKGRIDDATQSQKEFASATSQATEAQVIMATAEAIGREEKALRLLATAERALLEAMTGDVGQRVIAFERVRLLREDAEEATTELRRLAAAFNELQSATGSGAAPTATGSGAAPTTGFDFGSPDTSKQEALAKQLQDRLVAMTKTAVDDMQLEYDRLEAHIIEVDGAISSDWQTVLDDMQDKIDTVGLAEGFDEQIDALRTVVEGLGDEFSSASSSAAASLEALRADILDTKGGAEDFKKELEAINALLKGLPTDVDVSFIGALKDQAKSIIDPTAIVSSALGNLFSGGISSIVSGVMGTIGGLFGPSEEEKANTEAIKKNMEAANRLADGIANLSIETVIQPLDALRQALIENAKVQQREIELVRAGAMSKAQRRHDIQTVEATFFDEALRKFGLTMADVIAAAKSLGIDFQDLGRDGEALGIVLQNMNTFSRDLSILQKRFALLDITDPMEKFNLAMGFLGDQVGGVFGALLKEIKPENFDKFLEEIFADPSFILQMLDDDLTFEQFLSAIGVAEGALDGLASETEKATEAIRNAPSGFKVAAGRFGASDPVGGASDPVGGASDPVGGPGFPPTVITEPIPRDFRDDLFAPRATENRFGSGGTTFTVEGDIILQGVEDPRDFLRKLEDEVEWRARTGASVIPSKNEMRR